MERLFFWLGDWMNRLHRRYGWAYSLAVFCVGWLVMTVVARFGGAEGAPMKAHPWGSAVIWGFMLTCLVALMVRLFNSWR
jgi:hypothetical protein